MGKIAFVFSGQGAQYTGMGKSLYDNSPAAKTVFDTAETIRPGTKEQCFLGDKETLSQTINTQPCLYLVGYSAAKALAEAGITPDMVAGFSLGEIPALAIAGVFRGKDGFRFVCARATHMQAAAEKTGGSMAAVLKLTNDQVETLCSEITGVYPVNYNCPGQLVVAGEKEKLSLFCEAVSKKGGRALPLAVSGAFHSPLMDTAAAALKEELTGYTLAASTVPVYSNATAEPYGNDAKTLLTTQVNHPVLWQKTIENMIDAGATTFIELGAGKTLCGLIKKINPNVAVLNVEDSESLNNAITLFGKGM